MKKLKEFIFGWFVKKAQRREVSFLNYKDIESILLLYESDYQERNSVIKQLSNRLQNDGKTVCTWGYVEKKDITTLILPVGRILGSRDINMADRPKSEIIEDLKKEKWDVLIDLSQHDCLPLRYLALEANVKLKCGKQREDGVLDFMVNMPEEETPEKLMEEIIRYLQVINS